MSNLTSLNFIFCFQLGVMNTNNFDNLRSVLKFRSYTSFLETWGKAPDRSRGVYLI